jgi:uncharacterized membrane protein YphA (DoxX/SURF4 family)
MLADLSPYLLTFSRLATAFIFALSAINKLRDFPAFTQAVANFQILPDRWVRPAAIFLVAAELAIVSLLLLGGPFLLPGFFLAVVILVVFTTALISVLARKLATSCHCFGASAKPVTAYHLWRNTGFIALALLGGYLLLIQPATAATPGPIEQGFLGIMAITFVVVWSYAGEVVDLIRTT